MRLLKAVGVLGWLSASGALAQEAAAGEAAASEVPAPSVAEERPRPQFGAQLGLGIGEETAAPGLRLQLILRVNDYFAVGSEVGLYFGASSSSVITPRPGGGEDSRAIRGSLPVFALPLRVGLDRGDVRPALVLGPVGMASSDNGGLGFVAGAELGLVAERLPLIFDVRYYKRFSDSADFPFSFSLGVGLRFW